MIDRMQYTYIFFGAIAVFTFMMLLIIIPAATTFFRKRAAQKEDPLLDLLCWSRSVSFGLLASSIFVSLMWASNILSAVEVGMTYGLSGGFLFALGIAIPFSVYIFFIHRVKRTMPGILTFTEYIGIRYGERTKKLYVLFSTVLVIYVVVEQAVAVAVVFLDIVSIPFKLTTLIIILITTFYISAGGLRVTLIIDFFISLITAILLIYISISIIRNLGIDFIYFGLLDSVINSFNINYNPYALSLSGSNFFYAFVFIALGRIFLDQGFFTKAISAKSAKTSSVGFAIGGIGAMIPIVVIISNSLGHAAIALKIDASAQFRLSTDISPYIIKYLLGDVSAAYFAVLIMLIGISTSANCLLGFMSIASADYYKSYINETATQKEQIAFGRTATICMGFLCVCIAFSLDGVSLFNIVTFSGVLFAAPCAALILGIYSRNISGTAACISVFLGITTGIVAALSKVEWFIPAILSFLIPLLYLSILALIKRTNV